MSLPKAEITPFELPAGFGDDFAPAVAFVGIDPREHALDCASYYADLLFGDIVLVPFVDGEPDWQKTTRDTIVKFSGDWTELDLEDAPRLGVLTDSFCRFLGHGDDVSIVTLWREGTPNVRQIGGDDCLAAHHLITAALIDDEPLNLNRATTTADPPNKEPPKAANDNLPPKLIKASQFVLRDPALIPARQTLFAGHYVRKYLAATFGAGGGGKSAHAVSEAMAMVTGRDLLGNGPHRPLSCWYVNCEDPSDEIERRFGAAAIHFNVTAAQLGRRLYTDSGRVQEFVILKEDKRETRVVEPVVASIIAEIKANTIDVLIVDPFVSTHEVDENDNSKIQRAAAQWVRVAEEANCSVELIHHVRKSSGELTVEDGRGGGALKDKARDVRIINSMSVEQAKSAGIKEDDRCDYFRIDSGKANLKRRGGTSAWRRFVSVRLGNGTAKLIYNGDDIGVVDKWDWPSAGSSINEVEPETLDGIKARIGAGNYRESDQAGDWAGHIIAELLGIDTDDKDEKQRVKRMLKAWTSAGHFAVEQRPDSKRMLKKYVVPVEVPHHEN
jgi:hypothetical protein